MKKNVLVLMALFVFLSGGIFAQTTKLEWAKGIGGALNEEASAITVDGSGNVYTTGYFGGEIDFDPGEGVYNLNSSSGSSIFICKLDASGNFVWAKQIRVDPMLARGSLSITTDNLGNVYTAGSFGWSGEIDFDPGAGVYNLTGRGGDVLIPFICKLNSSGEFVWAKHFTGVLGGALYSISTDTSGSVYTTGNFSNTVDFDPGTGEFNLTAFGEIFESDVFISKLDSEGNFIWAKQIGGISNDYGYSMGVDKSGNIYTAGYYFSKADFDPGPDTFELTPGGIFIVKLNPSGEFAWAKQIAAEHISGVSLDNSDNIVVAGDFSGVNVDFNPGADTYPLSSAGGYDNFILKLSTSGEFIWAKKIGGINDEVTSTVDTDSDGNIYMNGSLYGTGEVDLDPGAGEFSVDPSQGSTFILKLDPDGNFVWANQLPNVNYFAKTKVDKSGNVYTTGGFGGTADFDPQSGVFNLTSAGQQDIFIQKLSQTTTGITEYLLKESLAPFPNPTSGTVIIENPFKNTAQKLYVSIYSIEGNLLKEYSTSIQDRLSIDLSENLSGTYVIKLTSEGESFVTKVNLVR